jgi:phosphoribosylformylglycinamidine synthase
MKLENGERREWIKPIMFTGGWNFIQVTRYHKLGIGLMDHAHAKKEAPETGMYVVKIGGPAYRIGFGGGSASSLVHGENKVFMVMPMVLICEGQTGL